MVGRRRRSRRRRPEPARADLTWVAVLGEPEVTFVETSTVGGQPERRVLFADGLEVDLPLFPVHLWWRLMEDPEASVVLGRGYRVLYDDLGVAEAIAALPPTVELPQRDPAELLQDFWYHALWAAKKLRRGEAITARQCVEGRMKALLLQLARRLTTEDTWHQERFTERWADPRVVAAFWRSAPSPDELGAVLLELCDVFDTVIADLGVVHPAAASARARLVGLLADASDRGLRADRRLQTAALVRRATDRSTGSACRASTRAPASPRCSAARSNGRWSLAPAARRRTSDAPLPRRHARARDDLRRPTTARSRVDRLHAAARHGARHRAHRRGRRGPRPMRSSW